MSGSDWVGDVPGASRIAWREAIENPSDPQKRILNGSLLVAVEYRPREARQTEDRIMTDTVSVWR